MLILPFLKSGHFDITVYRKLVKHVIVYIKNRYIQILISKIENVI